MCAHVSILTVVGQSLAKVKPNATDDDQVGEREDNVEAGYRTREKETTALKNHHLMHYKQRNNLRHSNHTKLHPFSVTMEIARI